jgi:hypothetical protein
MERKNYKYVTESSQADCSLQYETHWSMTSSCSCLQAPHEVLSCNSVLISSQIES